MIRETRESGNSRRWKFSSIGCTSILVNSTPTALKRAKGLGAKVGGVLNPTTGIECHAKAQSRKAKALRMVACSASGRAGFAARLFASLRLCVAPSSTISKFRFNCAGWRGGSYALVVSPSPTAHRARLETPPTLAPRVFHEPTERWVVFRASCAQSTPWAAPNGKLATRFQGGGPPSLPVPPLRGFGFFWGNPWVRFASPTAIVVVPLRGIFSRSSSPRGLAPTLYPHPCLLAQSNGALLRQNYHRSDPPGQLPERGRLGLNDQSLPQCS